MLISNWIKEQNKLRDIFLQEISFCYWFEKKNFKYFARYFYISYKSYHILVKDKTRFRIILYVFVYHHKLFINVHAGAELISKNRKNNFIKTIIYFKKHFVSRLKDSYIEMQINSIKSLSLAVNNLMEKLLTLSKSNLKNLYILHIIQKNID